MAQRNRFDPSSAADVPQRRLRLSTPGQVLAAVPFLLGFRPERSGVLICLRRRLVGLTMRFDLDLPLPTIRDMIAARLATEEADAAILVLFDPPAAIRRGRPGGALADQLMAVIDACGVRVQEALATSGGRYWSYLCRDRVCCPPHGRLVPAGDDADFNRVAAGFVAAGVAPMDTREALRGSVEPGADTDADRVRRARLAGVERSAAAALRRWRLAVDRFRLGPLRPGGGTTRDEAAVLIADIFDTPIRDQVILWCADPADRTAVLGVCQELAPLAPPPFHTQLLAVLAWAAYSAGEGALAGVALERALQTDPAHSLSQLLLTGLYGGIRPEQMRRLSSTAADLDGMPDAY